MSKQDTKATAISNFIMKICALERFIEVKRQILCDKTDFEPYVAFQRLTRSNSSGISAGNIQRFLSENLIDVNLDRCRILHSHYDSSKNGLLSYKEFLEIVLPKEHPDLRAFVTQRECYDIKEEEYLSYETEVAMAILLEREIAIFEEALVQKDELDNLALSGPRIVEIVAGSENSSLNFKNLQNFLHGSGLIPYDAEIINFLRRVDRDDDGVITAEEMDDFLSRFLHTNCALDSIRKRSFKRTNESKLKTFSPGRSIVNNRLTMLSPSKRDIGLRKSFSKAAFEQRVSRYEENMKRKRSKISVETKIEKKMGVLTESKKNLNFNGQQRPANKVRVTQSLASFGVNEDVTVAKPYGYQLVKKNEENLPPQIKQTLKKTPSKVTLAYNRSIGRLNSSKYSVATTKDISPIRSQLQGRMTRSRKSFTSFSRPSNLENSFINDPSKMTKTYDMRKNNHTPNRVSPSTPYNNRKSISKIQRSQSRGQIKIFKPNEERTPVKKRSIPRVRVSLKKETYNPTPEKKKSYKKLPSPKAQREIKTPGTDLTKQFDVFSNTLANIIEEEKMLEDSRKRLSMKIDFFPSEIFKLLDRKNRGKFTFEEFRYFLSQIGVIHTDTRSLIDLYSHFDSNQNCLLGKREFNLMIAPHDPMAKVNFDRLPASNFKGVSQDTVQLLATCFNRLFSSRKTILRGKKILKDNGVDLSGMFEELDGGKKGFLEKKDLVKFLEKFVPEIKESELEEVGLFVNRCDLDRDTRINFKDFYMFFTL